jgi:large subunit ribosomal protein L3
MGARRVTIQNLKVVKVDPQNNILLVEGAVPGKANSYLFINQAKKKQAKKKDKKA